MLRCGGVAWWYAAHGGLPRALWPPLLPVPGCPWQLLVPRFLPFTLRPRLAGLWSLWLGRECRSEAPPPGASLSVGALRLGASWGPYEQLPPSLSFGRPRARGGESLFTPRLVVFVLGRGLGGLSSGCLSCLRPAWPSGGATATATGPGCGAWRGLLRHTALCPSPCCPCSREACVTTKLGLQPGVASDQPRRLTNREVLQRELFVSPRGVAAAKPLPNVPPYAASCSAPGAVATWAPSSPTKQMPTAAAQ